MATILNDKKKILALVKKVQKLSEAGIQGEKETAKVMLEKLLQKYNLKKFELSEKPKKRTFKLANYNDCRAIMTHCILDTVDGISIEGLKSKKELYCKLSDEQYIDVCEKFNHYYPIYHSQIQRHEKQKDALLKAFLIKNNLGIVNEDGFEDEVMDVYEIVDVISEVEAHRYAKKDLKQLELSN